MRLKKQSVYESEIQLEAAKVAAKYNELGFNIYYNHKRRGFNFDLYAVNKASGEKIIFEFKHHADYNNQSASSTFNVISRYKETFPECRIIVVFIREIIKFEFEAGYLAGMLLAYINQRFQKEFSSVIKEFQSFEEVTDVQLTSLDFSDEEYIGIKGVGNIIFKCFVETTEINGEIISDGAPFFFKSRLWPYGFLAPYEFKEKDTMITFDFSEFKKYRE